jgi:hypothetical protein
MSLQSLIDKPKEFLELIDGRLKFSFYKEWWLQ